jgi:hypothetical protein
VITVPTVATFISMVLLSCILLMSSPTPSNAMRLASSPGLMFSDKSLALDSATDDSSFTLTGGDSLAARSCAAAPSSCRGSASLSSFVASVDRSLDSSVKLLRFASIGWLGAATTVDGSAESNALNNT